MPAYDPGAKRPPVVRSENGAAPVDALLGAAASEIKPATAAPIPADVSAPAPRPAAVSAVAPRSAPTPTPAGNRVPIMLKVVVPLVVVALLFAWRRRR